MSSSNFNIGGQKERHVRFGVENTPKTNNGPKANFKQYEPKPLPSILKGESKNTNMGQFNIINSSGTRIPQKGIKKEENNEDSWVGTNANLFDGHNEGGPVSEGKSLFGIPEGTSPQTSTTTSLPNLPSISEEPEKQDKITNPGSSPLEELLLNSPQHEDPAFKAGNPLNAPKKMSSGIGTIPPSPSLPSISEEPEEPSDSSPKASSGSDSESDSGVSLEAKGANGNPKIVESNIRSQKQSIGPTPIEDSSRLNKGRNPDEKTRIIISNHSKHGSQLPPLNPPSNRPW